MPIRKMKFADFVGNKKAIEKLDLHVDEARNNTSVRLTDFAFFGPSGYGKTTLARCLANEIDRFLLEINSTTIRDPFVFRSKVIETYTNNPNGSIILLDECHSLPRKIQDNLLSATEAPRILQTASKDQIFTESLPENCSFIFSTTHSGLIQGALLTRLERIELLPYNLSELFLIAFNYLTKDLGISKDALDKDGLKELAKRGRNGRQTIKFCNSIVRYMKKYKESVLSKDLILKCFEVLDIDEYGLTAIDRIVLKKLSTSPSSVGLETLEAMLPCTSKQIKEQIEPFLLQRGFILRTKGGRVLTSAGRQAISKIEKSKNDGK